MTRNRKIATIAALVALSVAGGTTYAVAGGDDGEGQATGPAAEKARAAALALFPKGEANAVERDSEDGATWEVEITRADGKTVDVRLDENYGLVVVEGDTEDANETEDGR